MTTLSYQTIDPNRAPSADAPDPRARAALRLLPSQTQRSVIGAILATLIAAGYLAFILQYWVPAHPGVDQNGYLAGGRLLSQTGSTGFIPDHATGFVGAMWVRVPETGMNYPKYPNGLPLLYAISFWVFGSAGATWAFLVSPISAAAAILGMYFLSRKFAGVFASVCAMLLLGFGQVTLTLANNPNSHASCLACVVWGAYLLICFWQSASIWQGVLGGFLLGYATTIRYSEGLLGLLIAVAFLSMIRWRTWRSYLRAAWPLLGWLIPVVYLVTFNLLAMGTPTGYDSTNESKPGSAFTIEHINSNWEKLARQVHDTGLFFIAPLGVLGMALAFASSSRKALLLWAWMLPGILVYMSYYWAPERGVSYLRFFLTLLPPLLVGVAVVFQAVLTNSRGRLAIAAPIGCAVVTALSCGIGLFRAIHGLEDGQETPLGLETQQRVNSNLSELGKIVTRVAPQESVIFASANDLNYLQFIGDYRLYARDYYTAPFIDRLRRMEQTTDPDSDPVTQQGERRRWLLGALEGRDEKQLVDMQLEIIEKSITSGRRVFLVMNKPMSDAFSKRVIAKKNTLGQKVLASYRDMPRHTPPLEDKTQPRPGGAMGVGALRAGANRTRDIQQTWQVVEIVRKVPTR
ncbi:MAG: glycosyltransferase family 39 protein [Burkholderiales bacterium]|nr:glycosyltransferase family 39 protein [Phycisphaerae bacterium]